MKIVRVKFKEKEFWGKISELYVELLKKPPYHSISYSGKKVLLSRCRLLVPTVPQKIICVGLNYRDHAKELKMRIPKEPIIFLKPPSALIPHKGAIIYPRSVRRLDYEAELAVVIRKKTYKIKETEVKKHILGFTCLNDITARDLQRKDIQWSRAKSFNTFCPLGPWIETNLDASNLKIQTLLNGDLRQNSTTKQFIFSIKRLISFISQIMTLLPGDVVSTGTPSGVGPMKRGDQVEVNIQGLGRLKNRII